MEMGAFSPGVGFIVDCASLKAPLAGCMPHCALCIVRSGRHAPARHGDSTAILPSGPAGDHSGWILAETMTLRHLATSLAT